MLEVGRVCECVLVTVEEHAIHIRNAVTWIIRAIHTFSLQVTHNLSPPCIVSLGLAYLVWLRDRRDTVSLWVAQSEFGLGGDVALIRAGQYGCSIVRGSE